MYRRVNSGGFIGAMTLGIVIVMAIFTWVIWGMTRQVYILTDVMVEMNESFKVIVVDMNDMSKNMSAMQESMGRMDLAMATMTADMGEMNVGISEMTDAMGSMDRSIQTMNVNMGKMTMDVGRATYAFSNPMSYMFGGMFPF